jgi:hypothetical protein
LTVVTAEKLPPFDVEAEEAVIASILVDEEAIGRVEGIVQAEDFYRDQNRWAYEACLALWARSESINQVTLAHELSRRDKLDEAGGLPYLARIVAELATPVGVEHYAGIVKRDATYRLMITAGSQIVQMAYQGGPQTSTAPSRAPKTSSCNSASRSASATWCRCASCSMRFGSRRASIRRSRARSAPCARGSWTSTHCWAASTAPTWSSLRRGRASGSRRCS